MTRIIQKILFGSPGTGKSYRIVHDLLPNELGIEGNSENCIKTVFHPDYSYGDFVGRIIPLSTQEGKVTYQFYAGDFLKTLALAYRNILKDNSSPNNVALIIDEINRGNSAAIFGNVFQLLDRDKDGWSDYEISLPDIEYKTLLQRIGIQPSDKTFTLDEQLTSYISNNPNFSSWFTKKKDYLVSEVLPKILTPLRIVDQKIRIPNNLHIIASMNTSDISIYYMDSAFKRRWEWEYIGVNGERVKSSDKLMTRSDWQLFVDKLNKFIRQNSRYIRNVEDKQIGYWFITEDEIKVSQLQNKLLFFLWDSVFNRDKTPLENLLKITSEDIVTFGDFCNKIDLFISKINEL